LPFSVVSAYRSPQTNAAMRQEGHRVAAHSFHMQGRAIDIYLPDRDLRLLHNAAADLRWGGVGYYPHAGFVHVDTGPIRYWYPRPAPYRRPFCPRPSPPAARVPPSTL